MAASIRIEQLCSDGLKKIAPDSLPLVLNARLRTAALLCPIVGFTCWRFIQISLGHKAVEIPFLGYNSVHTSMAIQLVMLIVFFALVYLIIKGCASTLQVVKGKTFVGKGKRGIPGPSRPPRVATANSGVELGY